MAFKKGHQYRKQADTVALMRKVFAQEEGEDGTPAERELRKLLKRSPFQYVESMNRWEHARQALLVKRPATKRVRERVEKREEDAGVDRVLQLTKEEGNAIGRRPAENTDTFDRDVDIDVDHRVDLGGDNSN